MAAGSGRSRARRPRVRPTPRTPRHAHRACARTRAPPPRPALSAGDSEESDKSGLWAGLGSRPCCQQHGAVAGTTTRRAEGRSDGNGAARGSARWAARRAGRGRGARLVEGAAAVEVELPEDGREVLVREHVALPSRGRASARDSRAGRRLFVRIRWIPPSALRRRPSDGRGGGWPGAEKGRLCDLPCWRKRGEAPSRRGDCCHRGQMLRRSPGWSWKAGGGGPYGSY